MSTPKTLSADDTSSRAGTPTGSLPSAKSREDIIKYHSRQAELVESRARLQKAYRNEFKYQVETILYQQKLLELLAQKEQANKPQSSEALPDSSTSNPGLTGIDSL